MTALQDLNATPILSRSGAAQQLDFGGSNTTGARVGSTQQNRYLACCKRLYRQLTIFKNIYTYCAASETAGESPD